MKEQAKISMFAQMPMAACRRPRVRRRPDDRGPGMLQEKIGGQGQRVAAEEVTLGRAEKLVLVKHEKADFARITRRGKDKVQLTISEMVFKAACPAGKGED